MGIKYSCDKCGELIKEMITEITINNYYYNHMTYYFCNNCNPKIIDFIKEKKMNKQKCEWNPNWRTTLTYPGKNNVCRLCENK